MRFPAILAAILLPLVLGGCGKAKSAKASTRPVAQAKPAANDSANSPAGTLLAAAEKPKPVVAPPVTVPPAVAGLWKKYCLECHSGGGAEGGLSLDVLLQKVDFRAESKHWLAIWRNLRAQTMPPAEETQPTEPDRLALLAWIERDVFRLDPARPDPGRVTIRRLNREEYRNTMQDMLGIDFNATDAFPPDDTGYGFDVIGDVLTISSLLMEKYIEAAAGIVTDIVPSGNAPAQIPTVRLAADQFRSADRKKNASNLAFTEKISVRLDHSAPAAGPYRLMLEPRTRGAEKATANTATLSIKVNDRQVGARKFGRPVDDKPLTLDVTLKQGTNAIVLELAPQDAPKKGESTLTLSFNKIEVTGPVDGSFKQKPKAYAKVFFEGPPPADDKLRADYARRVLEKFAERAYRRPVDAPTLDRLTKLAMTMGADKQATFETGIGQSLTAILASPRFLFRAEIQPRPDDPGHVQQLDDFALASRLSFFLWSSCPDDQLFALAKQGQLRSQLPQQVERMLSDPKAERLTKNFVGQWLQTRDVETLNFDARRILGLKTGEEAQKLFNGRLRRAMRQETEMMFGHLIRENRPLTELLVADYTFLNKPLADWYGVPGVNGDKMQKVTLPKDSHRGSLLTQASFLLVTSNPTRTSPVKRGLFVLDNLLGTPAPPAPADVPALEETAKKQGKNLTMRQILEIHRKDPMCASCHARMDPLGLALEEYSALGVWRNTESGKPIATRGQLITGEKFENVLDLSRVIVAKRRGDFYRCVTEKVLTYALGRGVEYFDAPAIDSIVKQLEADGGKTRTLLRGIVESAPFRLRRGDGAETAVAETGVGSGEKKK